MEFNESHSRRFEALPMASVSEPIVRRKLSDQVFERLKTMVTDGTLRPGDSMPSERELMERFGVGRPAIREAMQALSNIGLLAISHGERAKILPLTPHSVIAQVDRAAEIMLSTSPDALDHLKEARIFFERGIVRQSAEKATTKDIEDLRMLMDRQADALGTPEAFIAADMRFHTRIASICGNPIFEAVSASMLGWLKQYHTEMLIWTGKENVTLMEHAEIVDALSRNDAEAAEAALIRHLERSRALYVHQTP